MTEGSSVGRGTAWAVFVLIGISYSLLPAVMWPLASRLVAPERFGAAVGLMFVVQNAGISAANVIAGWLNDRAGAGADTPAGLLFALLLWYTAGRREQEAVTHAR